MTMMMTPARRLPLPHWPWTRSRRLPSLLPRALGGGTARGVYTKSRCSKGNSPYHFHPVPHTTSTNTSPLQANKQCIYAD
jgi:hypothetical protein